MVNKTSKRRTPRTIEEIEAMKDVFLFSKEKGADKGTLKCKEKDLEIKKAMFGQQRPGDKARTYATPFTEDQAHEICSAFGHVFAKETRRGK